MRHLAALGRLALACVFVLTQSTWAADSDADWRKDDAIVAAIATDNTYIKKFIANAYAKYPNAAAWKKTKPGYSGFKKDLKDLIDKSDPDNEADPDFITLLGKLKTKYGVKMKLPNADPDAKTEANDNPCKGKECDNQAQPVSKSQKATVQSISRAADDAAGEDTGEGKQAGGGHAPAPPKAPPEVVEQEQPVIPAAPAPAPEPPAPVVSAGASIQSNGGGGLGGLFGGNSSIMPFLGGALMGGILGSIMQRNGGGLGGLFGGGQFGGAPYGYPQYNMMGRGPFLPGRYPAPGAGIGMGGFGPVGGGYGAYTGGYGAPAFAPYVTNGGVYGGGAVQSGGYFSSPAVYGGATGGGALCTNCVLPSLYPAGAYVPGVH